MPCNADALRLSIVQFICAAILGWILVPLLLSFSSRTAICRTGDTAWAKSIDTLCAWLNCRQRSAGMTFGAESRPLIPKSGLQGPVALNNMACRIALGTHSHRAEIPCAFLTSGDQRARMTSRASALKPPANVPTHAHGNISWRALGAFRKAGEEDLRIALSSTKCIEPTDDTVLAADGHR